MDRTPRSTSDYKGFAGEALFQRLETAGNGLTQSEAAKRLALFGYNELAEVKRHSFLDFLLRYWGPMPWLLVWPRTT